MARVEGALRGAAGVEEASVDLVSGRALVRFDPSVQDRAGLEACVVAAGYTVNAPATQSAAEPFIMWGMQRDRPQPAWSTRKRAWGVVVNLVVGVLLMVLSMPLMGTTTR